MSQTQPGQIDSEKLKAQFVYLNKLRRMSHYRLREEHDRVFCNTRWKTDARLFTKEWIVKRLFFYFSAKNYHSTGAALKIFRDQAKKVLDYLPKEQYKSEEKKLIELRDSGYLSREGIQKLPINEVDGYLSVIGLYAKVSEQMRRKLLTAYLYSPTANKIRKTGNVRIKNKFVLRDMILKFPNLNYFEFMARFGDVMPTVSRNSFTAARKHLRLAGYNIGKLRPGPARPAIINKRAKHNYVN